jgi:hypothetical protein
VTRVLARLRMMPMALALLFLMMLGSNKSHLAP